MASFTTQKISFCGKTSLNIVTSDFKIDLLNSLQHKYNISIGDKSHQLLNNYNIRNIEKRHHVISLKTYGSSYFLYLTHINGINYCFYIDRRVKQGYSTPRIISVKYRFSDRIFQDTLFTGDMVRDNQERWLYLIDNILVFFRRKTS